MSLTETRALLKTYAIRAVHASSTGDVPVERVERGIEDALDMLSNERQFYHQQDTYDLVSVVPYTTGTLTVPTTTTVEFASTTLPSDIVGQFLEIGGERHWYEITTRTDDDTCVTRFTYNGNLTGGTASTAYKIVYPLIDLPGNFMRMIDVLDVESNNVLCEVPPSANWRLHSERAGVGTPSDYAIVAKRNDPNQYQMLLFPAPDAERQYQIVYYRMLGWYDTATPATSTWKRKATADTDYVDWPDKLLFVLRAAVKLCVAREIKPDKAMAFLTEYNMALRQAANMDNKSASPRLLSRGAGGGGSGLEMDF